LACLGAHSTERFEGAGRRLDQGASERHGPQAALPGQVTVNGCEAQAAL